MTAPYATWRARFQAAMDADYYPISHLDNLMGYDHAVMFCNEDAAIVTEIKTFPGGKRVVHGLVAAGDLDQIKALIVLAEQWGREQGCTAALIESRPGWAKLLKHDGYELFQVSIVKNL